MRFAFQKGYIKSNITSHGSAEDWCCSPDFAQGIVCIKFKLSSEAEECIRATAPRPEGPEGRDSTVSV